MKYQMSNPIKLSVYHKWLFTLIAPAEIIRLVDSMDQVMPSDVLSNVSEYHERDFGNRPMEHTFAIVPYMDEVEAWCAIDDAIKTYIKQTPWRQALGELGIEAE